MTKKIIISSVHGIPIKILLFKWKIQQKINYQDKTNRLR